MCSSHSHKNSKQQNIGNKTKIKFVLTKGKRPTTLTFEGSRNVNDEEVFHITKVTINGMSKLKIIASVGVVGLYTYFALDMNLVLETIQVALNIVSSVILAIV